MPTSTETTKLYLMECDQWICSDCWDELAESYYPYDLPVHQWIHLTFNYALHAQCEDARCSDCGYEP